LKGDGKEREQRVVSTQRTPEKEERHIKGLYVTCAVDLRKQNKNQRGVNSKRGHSPKIAPITRLYTTKKRRVGTQVDRSDLLDELLPIQA